MRCFRQCFQNRKWLCIRIMALLTSVTVGGGLFSAGAAAAWDDGPVTIELDGGQTRVAKAQPRPVTSDGAAVIVINVKRGPEPAAVPMPKSVQVALEANAKQQERYEINLLAKLMWGEARGIDSEMQKAAVAWCALNRVSSDDFDGTTIEEIVSDDAQFGGYDPDNPVLGNLYSLAEDVYRRWKREVNGTKHVGRVLGPEYYYFWGDGKKNYFVDDPKKIGTKDVWKWPKKSDPYPEIRTARLKKYVPKKEELHMLAQVIWRKARGVKSETQQAAVAWVVFNRIQSGLYPDTIKDVLEQDGQFSEYDPELEIDKKYYELAKDVADRWMEEIGGEKDVGRVLPATYLYFKGNGKKNTFFQNRRNRAAWKWTLKSPYETAAEKNAP